MIWKEVSTVGSVGLNVNDLTISKKREKHKFIRYPCTFDIEVTNYIKEDDLKIGVVYLWTFAVDTETIIYGRTIEEFKDFVQKLENELNESDAYLVVYVHNLAYEFQFLRTYFKWDNVFVLDNRRPLYVQIGHVEFRCSYMLSNMNLDNFLRNNNCDILKLSYNYNIERFPWDPISQEDLIYCSHDTAGLLEAILHEMDNSGDDITTIPYTSTGYVRREVKKSQSYGVRMKIRDLADIDENLYYALSHAFVGGNTHASRFFVNQELENVTCYDITSSYPYVQLTALYPVTPFKHKKDGLEKLKIDKKFAYLLKITFSEITCNSWDGMPNISRSKCLDIRHYSLDNGRVLYAETLTIWMTDIEYRITEKHYHWRSVAFTDCYYSRYGELPDCIKSCIYTYFEAKSKLKKTDPYLYRKSKEKLNSIYGMSAFDIGKRRYKWKDDNYKKDESPESVILEEALKSTQAEPYMWGVWTTARARENLDEVIRLAGDTFVYCDTDSVYCLGELDIDSINATIEKKSANYIVEFEGKKYIIGKWEVDKICSKFKTLGAKKYCYIEDGEIHTVTAGVSKKAGVESIEDYKIGHVFKDATNTAYYQDEPVDVEIKGHQLHIPTSVYIESNDYTLGVTDEYKCLLYYLTHGEGDLIFYE